ncbi:MAG: APC family permease [Acidimicrobiales bacterium]|jgi:amino acid transporter
MGNEIPVGETAPRPNATATARTGDTGFGEDASAGRSARGLKTGVLHLASSVAFGVASAAPAYCLAATVGWIDGDVRLAGPFLMMVGFIPMLLVVSAYYYWNRTDPDCGEAFIWSARAFGARIGWVVGFAAVASSVMVMANLVQVAALYMFLSLHLYGLANSAFWVTVAGTACIVLVTAFIALGSRMAVGLQYVLVVMQIVPLVVFSVLSFYRVVVYHPQGSASPQLSWFFSTHISAGSLAPAIIYVVFLYWGWDAVLAANEETSNSSRLPGLSAVLSTLCLVVIYVVVTAALQTYRGAGFLIASPNDVFSPVARGMMGNFDTVLLLSVSVSGIASALTTLMPLTRQTLSMAAHGSIPNVFGRIHERFLTPFSGTIILGVLSIFWYLLLTIWNPKAIYDSIDGLGVLVAVTYGGTGLAATVYFRHELRRSVKNFLFLGLFPSLGAAMFAVIMVITLWEGFQVGNTSGSIQSETSFLGIGGVFLIPVATLCVGIGFAIVLAVRRPGFFRRPAETWPGEGVTLPYEDERVEEE